MTFIKPSMILVAVLLSILVLVGTAIAIEGAPSISYHTNVAAVVPNHDADHSSSTTLNDFKDTTITIEVKDLGPAFSLAVGIAGTLISTILAVRVARVFPSKVPFLSPLVKPTKQDSERE